MKFPTIRFDENLHEVPSDPEEWRSFIRTEERLLGIANNPEERLRHLETLGTAHRILRKLNEAEVFLAQAVKLSEALGPPTRVAQNMARLGHVYQWKGEFDKAHALDDQIRSLGVLSEGLTASLHQHRGKIFFDQRLYLAAAAEFRAAWRMRFILNAPADQLESSENSVKAAQNRSGREFPVRRAFARDVEFIHLAHMRSIQEVCSKDHTADEIAGWGHRPLSAERRLADIANDWVWVSEANDQVNGYSQLKIFEKEGRRFGYISGLYLTPEIVGKFVGKSLFQIMLEVLNAYRAESLSLESTITARNFYKKLGFKSNGPEKEISFGKSLVRCYPMKMLLEPKSRENSAP